MDAWLGETCGLFLNFFGRRTPTETYVVVALCILFGALALSRVSTYLGALGAFYTTGVLVTVLGLVMLFAVMAVVPAFTYFPFWVSLIMAALVLLAVVVPLTVLLQRGGYVMALIAWTVTLLTIGAILTLEPIAMRSVERVHKVYLAKVQQIEKLHINTEKVK
jgi:signal transduction histidine kinase